MLISLSRSTHPYHTHTLSLSLSQQPSFEPTLGPVSASVPTSQAVTGEEGASWNLYYTAMKRKQGNRCVHFSTDMSLKSDRFICMNNCNEVNYNDRNEFLKHQLHCLPLDIEEDSDDSGFNEQNSDAETDEGNGSFTKKFEGAKTVPVPLNAEGEERYCRNYKHGCRKKLPFSVNNRLHEDYCSYQKVRNDGDNLVIKGKLTRTLSYMNGKSAFFTFNSSLIKEGIQFLYKEDSNYINIRAFDSKSKLQETEFSLHLKDKIKLQIKGKFDDTIKKIRIPKRLQKDKHMYFKYKLIIFNTNRKNRKSRAVVPCKRGNQDVMEMHIQ